MENKLKRFKSRILICCLGFCILSGCALRLESGRARYYDRRARNYYQAAVKEYKNLIQRSGDPHQLHFQLGQLYYGHQDFAQAIEEFKKTNEPQADKFLAISYYRLGDFTDALEVFSKNESGDGEYLYYYGLTCERLNLYKEAQEFYSRITEGPYRQLAAEHLAKIIQLSQGQSIQDLEPGLRKIIAEAPGGDLYPQAGALILLSEEKIEVSEDNTAVFDEHFLVKILNERGKKDFSEVVIGYDSTYEKVELVYARTIKPDGTVVSVGKKHIRDVSKYLNFPLYSNARAYIISMPEIAEGAIIEYRLKIHRNQLINKKDIVLSYRLQEGEPVIKADFTVILPESKKAQVKILNQGYNTFNARLNPQVVKEGNKLIYRLQFADIPQIIPEPNMPEAVEVNPVVLISTFESWEEIYAWWWNLAKDKMESSGQIAGKTGELIAGKTSAEEKIRAIYDFCAKDIRYVAIEYGQAGYEPHKAEEIFVNKYGDCKDQAVLLVTMLKQAGLKAYPVLIGTRESFDLYKDFPAVLFNHCIAAVDLAGKTVFLDPTAETCSFGDLPLDDQGRRVLLFSESGYAIETTPEYPAVHNQISQRVNIKINKQEGIFARKRIFTGGYYGQAQRFWLLYTQPELIRQSLKEKIQEASIGSRLVNYAIRNVDDLDREVSLEYKFKGPEYWTVAGPLRILSQLASQIDSSLVAKEKRLYPIDFKLLDAKETKFSIAYPSVFKVKYLPDDVHIDMPWLEFRAQYKDRDNIIYFRETTKLKKRLVLPAEYAEFKKLYLDIGKKIKQRVVLEKQ